MLLGHEVGLGQEPLDAAGAAHEFLVGGRQFVDAEDRDDVLQFLVALQDALGFPRGVVVFQADDFRVEDPRGGGERIDGRVDAHFHDLAFEHDARVKVRERRGRRRVGDIVGRHVDGLHRSDRALLGGSDALLQRAHLRGQGGLVADGGGHSAEQGGHLGAGLHEAEDVIDEEQHILPQLVPEELGLGQGGECHAVACAGRLIHLAEDQGGVPDDPRRLHFEPEVVAFPAALADSGEHGAAAVRGRDVPDQFHDEERLAHSGAAEQPRLAAAGDGGQQVDRLDARLLEGHGADLLIEGRRHAVDGHQALADDGAPAVDRLAEQVHHAA